LVQYQAASCHRELYVGTCYHFACQGLPVVDFVALDLTASSSPAHFLAYCIIPTDGRLHRAQLRPRVRVAQELRLALGCSAVCILSTKQLFQVALHLSASLVANQWSRIPPAFGRYRALQPSCLFGQASVELLQSCTPGARAAHQRHFPATRCYAGQV
jgi:hypothetical protein